MESLRTDHVARNGRYYRNGHHGPLAVRAGRAAGPPAVGPLPTQRGPRESDTASKKQNSDGPCVHVCSCIVFEKNTHKLYPPAPRTVHRHPAWASGGGSAASRRRLGGCSAAARWRLGGGSAEAQRRLNDGSAAARRQLGGGSDSGSGAPFARAKIDRLERASPAKIKGVRGEKW